MSKPAPGHKDAVYHTQCTGQALETVKTHSSPAEQTLFGACFCPFVHRVWIALEYLGGEWSFFLLTDIATRLVTILSA